MRYAGLARRFTALLIDLALFCSAFFPITRIVKGVWIMSATDHRWHDGMFISDPLCIIFFAIMGVYYVVLEGVTGTTVGKRLLGLRVVTAYDGSLPGVRRSFVRNVLRIVDGLPAFNAVGVWLIATDAERARFGDRVAGTRVVRA